MVGSDRNKGKRRTFDIMGVERKRKRKGIIERMVIPIVAVMRWWRRLSLKLLLPQVALFNGIQSEDNRKARREVQIVQVVQGYYYFCDL